MKPNKRIFKHLKINDKHVMLPPPAKENPFTVFFELDDIFVHTFLCDENFGYMANPGAKDPEHEFFLKETRQPVLVYERECMREFLDYLKQQRMEGHIEPIIFTNGQRFYADHLLEIIDPKRDVFEHVLY